jgi:IclR family transcriptional regulator, pca regulon regulatory protein
MFPVSAQIGFRLPALSSSLGRVLLAAMDDQQLDRFLAGVEPKKLTPATVVDKAELRRAIVKARTDGFSLVDQEAEAGFRSISVPLQRRDGRIIAALNIGAHSERGPLDTMVNVFLPKLQALAADLQQQII